MKRYLRSALLSLALFAAASTPGCGQDAAKESTPAVAASDATSSAPQPSARTSNVTVVQMGSAAPTASASAATPTGPVAAGQIMIDPTLAPNGILKPGEADKILAPSAPARVILLSPGAEPREVLRYDFKESAKQTTVMGMDMTMTFQMPPAMGPGGSQKMALPRISMTLELASAKKEADGAIPITGKITGVSIKSKSAADQQIAGALEKELSVLKGTTVKYVVTPTGRARDVKVEVAAGADPKVAQMVGQMQQSFESMVAPLPDDAVGEGARWQVVARMKSGVDLLQLTTYTLKKREGSKLQLETVIEQFASSAQLTGGQLPAGQTANISGFRSGGKGSSSVDLTALVPELGAGDTTSSMTLDAPQGKGSMTIDMSVHIDFARK